MKSKNISNSLFLIISSILPVILLSGNEHSLVSIIVLTFFLGSLTYLYATRNYSFLFAVVITANHVIYFSGAGLSRLTLFIIVFFVLMLFCLLEKPPNTKLFFITVSLVTVYILFLIVLKPNIIRVNWYMLYIETGLFFVFTQFVPWDIQKIKQVFLLHLLFIIVYGFFEFFITGALRIKGPMQSATAFGVVIVILWATWISIELLSKKPSLLLASAVTIPVIFIMIRTGTRMSFVGFAFTSMLIVVSKINTMSITFGKKIWLALSTNISLLLILVAVWVILPENLIIKSGFDSMIKGEIDVSNMGRIVAWVVAAKAFMAHPLFGIGNGNFAEFMRTYFSEINLSAYNSNFFVLPHAHNMPLTILSENGIIGFIISATLIIICIYSVVVKLRISKDNRLYGLLIGLSVTLFLGMFDSIPYFPSTQVWGAWFLAVLIQFETDTSETGKRDLFQSTTIKQEL